MVGLNPNKSLVFASGEEGCGVAGLHCISERSGWGWWGCLHPPAPSFHLGVRIVEAGRQQITLRVVLAVTMTIHFTAPRRGVDYL